MYMNKNKIFQILTLSALTLGMAGCSEDFLDRPPLNQYTAETFYSSDEAVIKATEPLYNKAWSYYNNNAIIGVNSLLILGGLANIISPSMAALLHNASTVAISTGAMRRID